MIISLFIAGAIGSFALLCCICYLWSLDIIDRRFKTF